MRRGFERDEKLAAVGVRSAVGHADHAASAVRQTGMELVRKGTLPETLAARAGAFSS